MSTAVSPLLRMQVYTCIVYACNRACLQLLKPLCFFLHYRAQMILISSTIFLMSNAYVTGYFVAVFLKENVQRFLWLIGQRFFISQYRFI